MRRPGSSCQCGFSRDQVCHETAGESDRSIRFAATDPTQTQRKRNPRSHAAPRPAIRSMRCETPTPSGATPPKSRSVHPFSCRCGPHRRRCLLSSQKSSYPWAAMPADSATAQSVAPANSCRHRTRNSMPHPVGCPLDRVPDSKFPSRIQWRLPWRSGVNG